KLESEAALSRLRTRRANLLLRLGYRTLAETDAARRAPGSAPIGVGTLPANEVWLPHRDERVIKTTRATRLPLMPSDLSDSALEHVYEKLQSNQHQAALQALAEASAERARGRGAQTMAILLEQDGKL